MKRIRRRPRGAVLTLAFGLGMTAVTLPAPPAQAKDWQGCHSDTRGHWARGYCYAHVDTKDLRLWVRCEGANFVVASKFDRKAYMSMGRRGPMPMKAAAYDCKERKVAWKEVARYDSVT